MKLHVLSLPWTETTHEMLTCAYTAKVVKFGKMMTDAGYEVVIYSGEENEAICTEHVPVVKRDERVRWFGEHDQNSVWGHVTWDGNAEPWRVMNARATAEIMLRAGPRDIICSVAGLSQLATINALPHLTATEPFVGYKGVIGGRVHCAYESHVWRHHVAGLKVAAGDFSYDDGRWYDCVVPNYFDLDQFEVGLEPDDYLLFMGRVSRRKNPHVAAMIAQELGIKLVVAGPGVSSVEPGRIVADGCVLECDDMEYVGVAGVDQRRELLANARALLMPTAFLEPFGGVAVEAMLSGTPAVTTDWGAFTETIREGVSGYRFRTLAEGVERTQMAFELDRWEIAELTRERYSLEAVAPQFDRWFRQLDGLWDGGWPTVRRHELDKVKAVLP
jgi:glycosyltransferase involved in cell wall biosynthesis